MWGCAGWSRLIVCAGGTGHEPAGADRVRCEIDRMETSRTFAAIGCTIAQVGNIAKNAGGTTVGRLNNKRLLKGQSEDSTNVGVCLMFSNRIMQPQLQQSHRPGALMIMQAAADLFPVPMQP